MDHQIDQWLVRTVSNQIWGPLTKTEVLAMIGQQKLRSNDEACSAGGYWFSLHERDEVKKWLGIEAVLPSHFTVNSDTTDAEITQPQMELNAVRAQPQSAPGPSGGSTVVPSPIKKYGKRALGHSGTASLEKPSLIRGMTWLLVACAAMILAAVVRLLRSYGI